jgi:hypothetical protein
MTPDLRLAIIERDSAYREGELHHILGRQKPRGWKNLPEPLKSHWPDVPMNLTVLSVEEHRPFAHITGRDAKRRFLQRLLEDHGDLEWCGKSYRDWLRGLPFSEFLGDCTDF